MFNTLVQTYNLMGGANRVNKLQGNMATPQGNVATLMHRTAPARAEALLSNSRAALGVHQLAPVPQPDTGEPAPGIFPATLGDLQGMNVAHTDTLLAFDGLAITGNVDVRRRRLALAIGCPL